MRPALTYETMERDLVDRFQYSYPALDRDKSRVRMVGLLFAPYYLKLTKDEILAGAKQFHVRSGHNIDFFFAGYSVGDPDPKANDNELVTELKDSGWFYSAARFNHFRQQVQDRAKWTYRGRVELLLVNAWYRQAATNRPVDLDFDSALKVDLEQAVKRGVIEDIPSFFESIFSHAENYRGDDPAWDFRKKAKAEVGQEALADSVVSVLFLDVGGLRKAVDKIREIYPFLEPLSARDLVVA